MRMKRRDYLSLASGALIALAGSQVSASAATAPPPARVDAGTCEVTVEVHDPWGTGDKGIQLLLDSSHSSCGEFYNADQTFYFGDYSPFDLKLPENAEKSYSLDNMVVDGSATITIPAGTYDYLILSQQPGMSYIVPSGAFSTGDDFEFVAGNSYKFTFEKDSSNAGVRTLLITEKDIAATALTLPEESIDLGEAEIGMTITNLGTIPASGIKAFYSADGGKEVEESVSGEIAPGDSLDFTFAAKADFSAAGVHSVTARVEMEGDMLPANNSASGKTRRLSVRELPFSYVFADHGPDGFEADWIVVNANNDDATWEYNEWQMNPDGNMGVAGCTVGWTVGGCDDWLVTMPIAMKAGKHHVSFSTRSIIAENNEVMEVCVGTSPKPADMQVAGTFNIKSEEWLSRAANFEVPEDGNYYVAFHDIGGADALNLLLDKISVEAGEFVATPKVVIKKMHLPVSNCDLPADAKVGVTIKNNGSAPLTDFTVSAIVDEKQTVTSTFAGPLDMGAEDTFYIEDTVDLSTIGTHSVIMQVGYGEQSEEAFTMIECFEPYAELPAYTNFSKGVNHDFWAKMDEEAWEYEPMFESFAATGHGIEKGIISRGAHFDGDARLKLMFAGTGMWGTTGITVLFGKAGADLSTYEKVYELADLDQQIHQEEITGHVSEPGNYSFVIADSGDESASLHLCLNDATVSAVFPHDIRITSISGPVSNYTPAAQLKGTGEYYVTVENRGTMDATGVQVYPMVDGTRTGNPSEAVAIPAGESKMIKALLTLPQFEEGDKFTVAFEAVSADADGYEGDNTKAMPEITVTHDCRALENMSEVSTAIGTWGAPLAIGNIYSFSTPSDLTGVTFGLAATEASAIATSDIRLNIYKVNPDMSLDRCIYSETMQRGVGGDFRTVDVPDMRLNPGSYYFEIAQLSSNNMGLAYMVDMESVCYNRVDDELSLTTAYALCIRAEFKDDAAVYAKDAAAVKFTSPVFDKSLFGSDETVSAQVRNNGYEDGSIEATLYLDGVRLGSSSLDLLSYESADLDFENVDLSVPGDRTLEIRVSMSGDENAANDVCAKTVVSDKELDPYTLDFEGCNDFAGMGDRFNPSWKTIDRSGSDDFDNFWRYSYPGKGERVGFQAFNPSLTVPSMIDDGFEGMFPHSGSRMGVAFMFSRWSDSYDGVSTENDTWLISPKLKLGDNSSIEVWVKTRCLETLDAKLEPYRILVSETDDEPESFKVVGSESRTAPTDWTLDEADLSAYDNKDVYVAIQYVGTSGNVCLLVDDIKVKTQISGVGSLTDETLSVAYDGSIDSLIVNSALDAEIGVVSAAGIAYGFSAEAGTSALSMASLPAGVYMVKATTAAGTAKAKFVKR